MTTEFHSERKAWSAIKHVILEKYIALFVSKLGSSRGRLFFVDGFAGQGRYGDGSEGSPLISAKRTVSPISRDHIGVLNCINVEDDPEAFQNLQENTKEFVERGFVRNLQGTFQDRLDEILQLTRGQMALFFIDPFGAKGVELDQLETIAKRGRSTEVLVRFDDIRVKRLITQMAGLRDKWFDEAAVKTAASFQSLVKGLADENAISSVLDEHPNSRQLIVEGYENLVKRKKLFRYSLSYPIRNPTTSGHRYFLVHFANHPDAYTHMARFMAAAERSASRFQKELFAKEQMLLGIDADIEKDVKRKNVERIAIEINRLVGANGWKGKSFPVREIFALVVDAFRWKYLGREWTNALDVMAQKNLIKLTGKKDSDSVTFL
jgi:three-Cys-motif partner protein